MKTRMILYKLVLFYLLAKCIASDISSQGIMFNEESKILLAEKFVNVEFLIPFPKFNFSTQNQTKALLVNLSKLWEEKSAFCPMDFTSRFNSSMQHFNFNWLYDKIVDEVKKASEEVDLLYKNSAQLLTGVEKPQKLRDRRGAPILALAGLAGIGLFGSGLAMGSNDNCGISGIFGSCQNLGRENAENIEALNEYATVLTEYVLEIESESNEKFFLISNELSEVKRIQKQMQQTYDNNWKLIMEQFAVFQNNIRVFRDCTQVLFSNQQLNFNFDTVAALLSLQYTDIKSYRSALYAYQVNVLNSIPTLLDHRLPMSLVPRESLISILDSVYNSRKVAVDRLSLAIPMEDLLSYYDSKLVREVSSLPQGLLITMSIPLSSKQTTFDVFKAHLIPMPQKDSSEAIEWVIEGPYLAISEDSMETTVLSDNQFQNCMGSSKYRICHTAMETQLGQSSCLATLYFHNVVTALTVCDTKKILLPTPERATNLGYGIWLLTSASDKFSLREYRTDQNSLTRTKEHPGCHACIVTLECGTQLITKHIKIRADLDSCAKIPAIRINVGLPDPLEKLLSTLPDINELPYFDSITDASISLIREVKLELSMSPHIVESSTLESLAKPISHRMTLLKPKLLSKLDEYVPIKLSLSLTIIVFLGNILLHAALGYLYHRVAIVRRFTPKFLKFGTENVAVKPVVSISAECGEKLNTAPQPIRDKWHLMIDEAPQTSTLRHGQASAQLIEENSSKTFNQNSAQIETSETTA